MPKQKLSEHASVRDIPRCLLTYFIFAMIFIAFRASGIGQLSEIGSVILHGQWLEWPPYMEALYYIIPFFVIEWLGRRQEFPLLKMHFPRVLRWTIYWGLLIGIALASLDKYTQFIYFQF